MLLEQVQQLERRRLPSIHELVLPPPAVACPPEPVRVRDEEDCARILAGLQGPGSSDEVRSSQKLPSISCLFGELECLPSPAYLRRGSCESIASTTPSLASTASVASSPPLSPRSPTFRVPFKFGDMTAAEQVFAEARQYDFRADHHGYVRRRSSLHMQEGRIVKPSSPPPHSRCIAPQALHAVQAQEKPRRAPPRSRGKPHNNIPYTEEQNHWVIYHKVDLGLSWREVEDRFNLLFPLPPPYDRTDGGLQSTFYRWNDRMPLMTDDWLLVLDDRSRETYAGVGFRTHKVKVRASGKSGEASGNVTLIARYAEQIVDRGYSWIRPADMATAREVAIRRRKQRQEYLEMKAAMRSRF
ncbi:hypothetical protein GQ53DRAFT_156177 [Thozetella sp. PMI_491]|nr:hypothetical protein GQ53DRAFT_156177 [Thozetella sp. PMI_491]